MEHPIPLSPKLLKRLIALCRPRGWRVAYGPYRRTGVAEWREGDGERGRGVILCPVIRDLGSLVTYLHECGHVNLGHFDAPFKPEHVEEYEAENYAISTLKAWGVDATCVACVEYVRGFVQLDEAAAVPINKEVTRWIRRMERAR